MAASRARAQQRRQLPHDHGRGRHVGVDVREVRHRRRHGMVVDGDDAARPRHAAAAASPIRSTRGHVHGDERTPTGPSKDEAGTIPSMPGMNAEAARRRARPWPERRWRACQATAAHAPAPAASPGSRRRGSRARISRSRRVRRAPGAMAGRSVFVWGVTLMRPPRPAPPPARRPAAPRTRRHRPARRCRWAPRRRCGARRAASAVAMRSAWSTLVSNRKRSSGATRHDSLRAMSERMRPERLREGLPPRRRSARARWCRTRCTRCGRS